MGQTGHTKTTKAGAARTALALVAAAILLLALAAPALATPSHPRLAALDITGLNHACGTAVDSKGDVYASSAGESKIKVFNAAHTELTSIPNANEPCGLAVDTSGNLYVSEAKTGNVVKYHPTAYPFAGSPTYEAPTTIDSSGNAKGISVDPTDNSLYVAEGTRVTVYKSDGTLFTDNEIQRIQYTGSPSAGTFTLSFEGKETAPLPFHPGVAEIQAALEGLSTIGAGNVTVSANSEPKIAFLGTLAATDLPQLAIDPSGLTGGSAETSTGLQGSDGHLGEGELTDATGVASYTSPASSSASRLRYISVADVATGKIKVSAGRFESSGPGSFLPGSLEALQTIDGSEAPAGELGLASSGAYLGVDPANGHLFSYDATHAVLDEFQATGQYFTQVSNAAFVNAKSTAIAVDRSGGVNDGTLYLTAGAGPGAKVLAFGPLPTPSRATLAEPPAHKFKGACGTVVDSKGDLYVAGESIIRVYGPAGSELTSISDPGKPCALAVDSAGNLYAVDVGGGGTADDKVVLYEPSSYPFSGTPTYTEKSTPIETLANSVGIAVNPKNDHLFVTHSNSPSGVVEYDSAANGSALLKSNFCGLSGEMAGIDIYGANGDVYVTGLNAINVCNSAGTKQVAEIDGSGSPAGPFEPLNLAPIAIDQSDGDVLVGEMGRSGIVEEFEASGAFVQQFGSFAKILERGDLAIDNSGGPQDGDLYVAFLQKLTAFGPLSYGELKLPTEFPLTVSTSGTGSGTVSSEQVGINCNPTCSAKYEAGTEVTLTASPASGSTFAGFSGACSGTATCKVTMTEAKSVGAEFTEEESSGPVFHKLSVSVTGNGSVSANTGTISGCTSAGGPSCEGEYEAGSKVTLTEAPAEGSLFGGWQTLQCDESTASTCEVTIGSGDEGVAASFTAAQTLKVAVEGSGTITSSPGLVSCTPFCEDSFPQGAKVTLTATPSPGSAFLAWRHCDSGGVSASHCTVTMDKAKAVTAVFAQGHALTVKSSGLGKVQSSPAGVSCLYGCQSATAAYNATAKVTLKEAPAKHFHFAGWSGDCEGAGPCEVSMGQGREVKALFAPNAKYSLTLRKAGAGKGILRSHPAGISCAYACASITASYDEGEEVALEVSKVALGSSFGGWSGGGCSGTAPTCTVAIDEAKEVKAEFK